METPHFRWWRSRLPGVGAALAGLLSLLVWAAPAAGAPLADRHQARGVSCEACHKTVAPTAAPASSKLATQQCLSCHESYEKLASRTNKERHNPHMSHEGKIPCNDCHKSHQASVDYCAECHQFGFKVP